MVVVVAVVVVVLSVCVCVVDRHHCQTLAEGQRYQIKKFSSAPPKGGGGQLWLRVGWVGWVGRWVSACECVGLVREQR